MKFKYNINHIISYQPKKLTVDKIAEYLEKAGIPRRTFDSDKSIKVTDDKDIPGERLLIYARLFSVSLEQLYNYDKKMKALPAIEPSPDMQKIIRRAGLKQST
jgi:hypothetical protein